MGLSFLGFDFLEIELGHRETLSDLLSRYPQPLSGYTFGVLAAWQPIFHYGWVPVQPGALLLSYILEPDPNRYLLQPVGPLSPAVETELLRGAAALPYALKIVGVCGHFLENNGDFIRHFDIVEDRAAANYVYRATDLARLPGRKYAKKRNLLSQAANLYRWSQEPMTSASVEACFAVLKDIQVDEQPNVEGSLGQELATLEVTLRHFDELAQEGILVRVEKRPVAFSIYEAINPTTVAIHFERALRSYKGLYQVINREAAQAILNRGFEFINREEDLGDPGLREAKLSYHPAHLVTAYEMVFRG